jgi:hypothetical protein
MYVVIYAWHVSVKAKIRNGDCLMWPRARSVCGATQLGYTNIVRPHKGRKIDVAKLLLFLVVPWHLATVSSRLLMHIFPPHLAL